MKKLALLGLLLFSFPACSSAQIYSAGSGYYQNKPSVVFPWEVSLGLTGAFSPVEEPSGERLSNCQFGVSARALYYLMPWFAVGPEGTLFFPTDGHSIIEKYRMRRAGLAVKLVSSGETSTRSYGVFGAGFTRREAEYVFNFSEDKNSSYFALGFGLETDVGDTSFIGVEVRALYNTHAELGMYSRLVSRWEADVSVRAGVRF